MQGSARLVMSFFATKATFFKKMKDESADNLARKHKLCERAEALKDSTDWKKTADELTAMQKEWKTIGPVSKKEWRCSVEALYISVRLFL